MSTQADRPGWLTFAAVVMFSVAALRVISAIYYFADSRRINDLTGGAFGQHLFAWGIADLMIAVLALFGGYSLLGGHTFGRVIGYIWAGFVIVDSFLLLRFAPWFGVASMTLAVFVLFAISNTSGWTEKES